MEKNVNQKFKVMYIFTWKTFISDFENHLSMVSGDWLYITSNFRFHLFHHNIHGEETNKHADTGFEKNIP